MIQRFSAKKRKKVSKVKTEEKRDKEPSNSSQAKYGAQ